MMPRPLRRLTVGTLCLMLLTVAACSGPRETTAPPSTDAPAPPPPPEAPREPVTRTVQGFRVQIFTSADRDEAYGVAEDASAWWRTVPETSRPPYLEDDDLAPEVAWQAPYYRVRVGAFATRAEAERALAVLGDRYDEAFIVPDRVTVTR